MGRLLNFVLLIGVSCFSGSLAAEPIVYEFEGYLARRHVQDLNGQNTDRNQFLPAGFEPGAKLTGRMTYDRELRYFDAEVGEDRAAPVTNLWIRTESGGVVSRVGQTLKRGLPVNLMTPDRVEAHSQTTQGNALLEVRISWQGPGGELAPGQVGTISVLAIPSDCVIENCFRYESALAAITRAVEAAPAPWTPVSSRFDSGAAGWTPVGGTTWTVTNGYYRSSSNVAAAISLSNVPITDDFTVDASVHLEWSAAGNRGGLVYDYRDAKNYRGVLVNANSASIGQAVLEIFEVTNGVRRVVATRDHFRPRYTWGPVSVARVNGITRINNEEVAQAPIHGGKAGLLASFNMVRFDDVVIATPSVAEPR
jgi:hypothetical protein